MQLARLDNIILYISNNITIYEAFTNEGKEGIFVTYSSSSDIPIMEYWSNSLNVDFNDLGSGEEFNSITLENENLLYHVSSITPIISQRYEHYEIGFASKDCKYDPYCIKDLYRSYYGGIDKDHMIVYGGVELDYSRIPIHLYFVITNSNTIIPSLKLQKDDKLLCDIWIYPMRIDSSSTTPWIDILIQIMNSRPIFAISHKSSYRDIRILCI